LSLLGFLALLIFMSLVSRRSLALSPSHMVGGASGSHSTDVVTVDSLLYDTKEHHPTLKNRPIKSFRLPLPLEDFPAPRKNSSLQKELKYLAQLNAGTVTEQRDLALAIERNGTLRYFIDYAGRNGLMYDEGHLKRVSDDVTTLAYLLKSYYNRPRPYQLGFLLGYNIIPVTMADSSSYPCEHTLVSKVLAYQLAYNNPRFAKQVHALAKRIELSRYYGGLNFPSDTVASIKVAKVLKKNIKYLEAQ
jgi:hypothetical protein